MTEVDSMPIVGALRSDTDASVCLNVYKSVIGQVWSYRYRNESELEAYKSCVLSGEVLSDMYLRVLAGRGIAAEDIVRTLNPKLASWIQDPDTLADCAVCVERLAQAIQRKELVAVLSDYDVDGITSLTLLTSYLEHFGCPFLAYIPDRQKEGYGPNNYAVQDLFDRGARLLVTLDCGSMAFEAFAYAKALGMTVVVIDHHQTTEVLPEALAVVNPNRKDDRSGLTQLCAAGVVFYVLIGLNRFFRETQAIETALPDLLSMLDLVAVATLADIVPLKGVNRAFVKQGIKVLDASSRCGWVALKQSLALKGPLQVWHIGFVLGPTLNAAGRLGDALQAVHLLKTNDVEKALRSAEELVKTNQERQQIERTVLNEAIQQAEAHLTENPDSMTLVLGSKNWHPGVIGIVASRIKDRFHRPTVIFSLQENGTSIGSGRSIQGVDLGEGISHLVQSGVVKKGGGHEMAAGLTLHSHAIMEFYQHLEALLRKRTAKARSERVLWIDDTISLIGCTLDFIERLEKLQPYGRGFPEPVIAIPEVKLVHLRVLKEQHLSAVFSDSEGGRLSAIAFRAYPSQLYDALAQNSKRLFHLAGILKKNEWNGKQSVQLHLLDLQVCE